MEQMKMKETLQTNSSFLSLGSSTLDGTLLMTMSGITLLSTPARKTESYVKQIELKTSSSNQTRHPLTHPKSTYEPKGSAYSRPPNPLTYRSL